MGCIAANGNQLGPTCGSHERNMLSSSFQGLKNVVVVVYGTTKGDVGERDFGMICTGLWIKVGNGYILCILEDMSGFVGGKVRLGITGGFGVSKFLC